MTIIMMILIIKAQTTPPAFEAMLYVSERPSVLIYD